jgi:two-component system, NtrC family, response regulator PilR
MIPWLTTFVAANLPSNGEDSLSEQQDGLTEKIRWLLLLRVVIVSFFLGATALFYFLRTEGDLGYLFDLSIPLVITYAISIASVLLLPRVKALRLFAHAQVSFDVILITGIVSITGEITSPFGILYNLAVMNGAILLFYRGAFFAAGCSSIAYASLLIWSRFANPGHGLPLSWAMLFPIAQSIASFFAIAWLSGFLTNKLSETEKLLKEKQDDYRDLDALKDALLQGIGSGVAVTDEGGRINYLNRQAQALTAFDETTIKGKRLDQVFPGLAYDFQRNRSAGAIVTDELSISTPQGAAKQIRLTVAPLSNTREQVVGFVAIFEDITKQKQVEEKIRIEEELRRAREVELPEMQNEAETDFHFEGVIGKTGGIEKIHKLVQKVSATNTNVLITGESGTGKELVARAIHLNGPRKSKPFIAVNCGAIPETLMESELFGHVRGAFTGAVSDHTGLFKQADQGTIFLDEVGELALHLQVKLLRVLQEKSFTPVGGSKPVKVDIRVISATNKDLRKELDEGRFREDLFYRLNVVHMVMPPLRSRKEDIPALAHYFLRKFADSHGKRVEEISSGALLQLMNYSYPGNVRELENIIEHAVAIAGKNILTDEDLPQHIRTPLAGKPDGAEQNGSGGPEDFFDKGLSLDTELETYEKHILLSALKRANGVQKRAAEILGINYRSLRHRLEKYDLLSSKADLINDQAEDSQ